MKKEDFIKLSKSTILHSIIEFEQETKHKHFVTGSSYISCICTFKENEISLAHYNMIRIKNKINSTIVIKYSEISLIEISICKRLSPSTLPRNYYHLDLVINTQDGDKYYLESELNGKTILNIFKIAKEKNIAIDDRIGLSDIVHTVFFNNLYEYLENNFNELSKKFNLDNPRLSDKIS